MAINKTAASSDQGAGKASIWGWIFYEGGIGPYFVLVNIFVFSPYFTSTVINDPIKGQAIWGYIQAGTGVIIASLSPFLGSLADAAGPRKPGIAIFTITAIMGMSLLWFVEPGISYPILLTCVGVVIAGVSLEFAAVYHNSMLTTVARPDNIGKIGGIGYAASYFANFIILVAWLLLLGLPALDPGTFGELAFGLSAEEFEHNRIAGLAAALMIIAFCPFLFFFTKDLETKGLGAMKAMRQGTKQLIGTIKQLPRYKNIARYLLARMIYYDGLQAVFIFAGIYAALMLKMETGSIVIYALAVMFFAFFSSLISGYLDDHYGSKRTVIWSVILFATGCIGIAGLTEDTIFYFWTLSPEEITLGEGPITAALSAVGYDTLPKVLFLIFGTFTGTFSGPALSSSRTMLARIAPLDKQGEFFGLYALLGKATSFMAPLVIGFTTDLTGDLRLGYAPILLFFIVGLGLLLTVKEERAE